MPVDEALLEAHRSYREPSSGYAERFVRLRVGSSRTFGILSTPLGAPRPVAWVSCHSFGTEQTELQRVEAATARRLSTAGFPVLRFHCQGYGDSEEDPGSASLSTHVRDTLDAARWLAAQGMAERVGLIGWKLGGAVAALAAERMGLSPLVMIAPTVNGARYIGELLRRAMVRGAGGRGGGGRGAGGRGGEAPGVKDLRDRLMADGLLDLNGFPLHRHVVEEIEALTLPSALRRAPGRSLIVQISRGTDPHASSTALATRVTALGGTASVSVVEHEYAPAFGAPHFRPTDDPIPTLQDVFAGIDASIAEAILEWQEEERPPTPSRAMEAAHIPTLGDGSVRPPDDRDGGVKEFPVFVPVGDEHLSSIVTVPDGDPRGLIALLQGGGGAPRSHQGAMWKIAARLAAERGLATVRLDWRGVGDSTGRVTMDLRRPAVDDVGVIIRFAQRATGTEHLGLAGNCYGARTALGVARLLRPCSLAMVMLKPTAHMKRPVTRWVRLRRLIEGSPIVTEVARRARALSRRMGDRVRPSSAAEVFAQISDVSRRAPVLVMEGEAERRDGRLRRAVAAGRRGLGSIRVVDLPGAGVRAFDSLERQRFVVTELAEWFDRTMPAVDAPAESTPAETSAAGR